MQKGNVIASVTILFIGILLAVTVVANIALPTVFTPTDHPAANVESTLDVSGIANASAVLTNFTSFTLVNPSTGKAGVVTITAQLNGADYLNVTNKDGTVLGTVSTSPTSVTVPGALMSSTTLILNYTSNTSVSGARGTNMTNAALTYYQPRPDASWDSGTTSMWLIVGVALVAMLLLFVFKGAQA